VALATCPIHACHIPCDAKFCIKKLLEGAPFKVNYIQLELLGITQGDQCSNFLRYQFLFKVINLSGCCGRA